jgi:hypothetical protein
MANPAVSSAKRTTGNRVARAGVGEAGTGVRAATHAAHDAGASLARVREFVQLQLDRALMHGEVEVLIGALLAATRRRTPAEVEPIKAHIFQQILQRVEDPSSRRVLWIWMRQCAARPETEVREMACAILDSFWRDHRKEVERLTLNLARDEDEGVRQYAAATMSRIIRANFRLRLRHLQLWSRNPDPSVRRQVIIATVGVADPAYPERAKPLLDLLEPHLSDRDPYVRRNLGPFALGQGLLRAYPEATLVRFKQWLRSEDEIVLWNIGIALAAVHDLEQWEAALEVLRVLAADQRRFVWGAASAGLANLAIRRPEQIKPILRRWMRDPKLRVSVSSAQRGIPC